MTSNEYNRGDFQTSSIKAILTTYISNILKLYKCPIATN